MSKLETGAATPSIPANGKIVDAKISTKRSYKRISAEKQICLCNNCFIIRDFYADYYKNQSIILDGDPLIFSVFCKELVK